MTTGHMFMAMSLDGFVARESLIDDMTVTVVPILIGTGKRMFGALNADIDLRLLESKSFPSGLVTSRNEVS